MINSYVFLLISKIKKEKENLFKFQKFSKLKIIFTKIIYEYQQNVCATMISSMKLDLSAFFRMINVIL